MEADGNCNPVLKGQTEDGELSDDSDNAEVIIELDQSQIASPSESEEDLSQSAGKESDSVESERELKEYFDNLSDDEADTQRESARLQTETKQECKEKAINVPKTECRMKDDEDDKVSSSILLPQALIESSDIKEVKGKHLDSSVVSVSDFSDEQCVSSQLSSISIKTKKKSGKVASSLSFYTKEVEGLCMADSGLHIPAKGITETDFNKVLTDHDGNFAQEVVSSANNVASTIPRIGSKGGAGVTGSENIPSKLDNASEVSSAGDAPVSLTLQSEMAEQAAHAEVLRIKEQLASLGAEPVSDPESGEDMGSDDSSPEHSVDYDSAAFVTSTSRHSMSSSFLDMNQSHREVARGASRSDLAFVSDSTSDLNQAGHSHKPSYCLQNEISTSSYMENISDDENIGDDAEDGVDTNKGSGDKRRVEASVSSSSVLSAEECQKVATAEKIVNGERLRRPIMIASLGDKRQVQTHFSEELVELDYEDVDGEGSEGECKPDGDEEDGKEEGEKSDKDEGELDDDDDCEEGEIKEPGNKRPYVKPLCRFYLRSACTWGLNCRFLHPGVNDKGVPLGIVVKINMFKLFQS